MGILQSLTYGLKTAWVDHLLHQGTSLGDTAIHVMRGTARNDPNTKLPFFDSPALAFKNSFDLAAEALAHGDMGLAFHIAQDSRATGHVLGGNPQIWEGIFAKSFLSHMKIDAGATSKEFNLAHQSTHIMMVARRLINQGQLSGEKAIREYLVRNGVLGLGPAPGLSPDREIRLRELGLLDEEGGSDGAFGVSSNARSWFNGTDSTGVGPNAGRGTQLNQDNRTRSREPQGYAGSGGGFHGSASFSWSIKIPRFY